MPSAPLPYSPDLETIEPDEAETQNELIATFRSIIDTTRKDHGHAFRSVHAKSHALLDGDMRVRDDLAPELAQGIFRPGARYPVAIRISTNAGDPLPDTISLPRGMAIKVIGIEGERLSGSEGQTNQDFVLAVGPAFSAANPAAFLRSLKLLAATTDRAEWGKKAISAVFRWAEKGLEAVGAESATLKTLGGYPHSHPLGETYFSQVPIRFGDYVAKVRVAPLSASFTARIGEEIDVDGRENALREDLVAALASEGGEWEFAVQLRRDAEANPVEDASKPWPEEDNPYLPVATIHVAPQTAWSEERAAVLDERVAFSPWDGVIAHRPLGGVMRARKPAYADSAAYRSELNGCPMFEPRERLELP